MKKELIILIIGMVFLMSGCSAADYQLFTVYGTLTNINVDNKMITFWIDTEVYNCKPDVSSMNITFQIYNYDLKGLEILDSGLRVNNKTVEPGNKYNFIFERKSSSSSWRLRELSEEYIACSEYK